MADNFFKEPAMEPQDQTQPDEQQLPEAIKVGDKAYTQEELQSLVGLGESARELESKWSTKIDRLMPEYTKTRQQLADYERQQQDRQRQDIQSKVQTNQQLSPDELRQQAVVQLKDLLNTSEGQQFLRESYLNNRGAEKLIEDSEFVIGDYAEQGFEAAKNVTVDDLLNHMASTGIRNPDKALRDMLEPEYDNWKSQQLQSLKQPGLMTSQASDVGSKQPPSVPVPRNSDQLKQALRDFMASSGQ